MRIDQRTDSDAERMALLDTDPDRGMEALVEQYTALICHVAGKYLTASEDVKECVNDVFMEVYLHRAEYVPEKGSLAAWIGTIARNRAISLYRKQRKDLPLPEEQVDGEPAGPDRTAQLEQAMDVERAVSQLNETDQNIIRMKYYGGMSISEIAETLYIPYETVKKRHTRSIKRLRKLLITILVIAALLVLAACGVIRLLRYFGLLPGYGVVTEPGVSCSLMQEHTPTVQTEQYTAWIESARLYNGELTVEYRLEVPEQPFETEWDEAGVAVTNPLDFRALLCNPDGTPLPDQTCAWSGGIADYYHGSGTGNLTLEQEGLDELEREGQIPLELHLTDVFFDGRKWPDAVIPFTLVKIQEQALEHYPGIYDEAAGGFLLDSRMEDGMLVLDVYPISNGTMEFFGGLTLPPNAPMVADAYEPSMPLTIVGEDGVEYTGEPADETLSYLDNGVVRFIFPDAPPGRYTLKLPYVYLLLKQEAYLTWNLLSGKPSDAEVFFPGGSFCTVSITELEPDQTQQAELGLSGGSTHIWEIAVQCEFDSEEMTALQGSHADQPELRFWSEAEASVRRILFGGTMMDCGMGSMGFGQRDPESGALIYQIYADDRYIQTHDLQHVHCNPAAMEGDSSRMVLRYDHPMELELEVQP